MTDIRSLERTLLDNLPWNKARIKTDDGDRNLP
jgi:hypothetical protein